MKSDWRTNKRGDHYIKKAKVHAQVDSAAEDAARAQMSLSDFMSSQEDERIARYKAKQEAKAARFKELAEKHKQESEARLKRVKELRELVPMGQPILVGHHSERMHRAHIKRVDQNYQKAFEHADTAKYYEHKAELAEKPKSISADDPEAIKKLQAEIDHLEKVRNYLKNEYKVIPGVSDFKQGSEHWRRMHLEATTRNIRDKQKRIEALRQVQTMPDDSKTINDVQIVSDKNDNRVRLIFPAIPSPELRAKLKSYGWRWSPYNKAWQRMISNQAIYQAEEFAKDYK